MATHDYNLANQDGASFRSDLNNALSAIVSNNSSSTAPATTFAHQIWVDTTANVIKQRNAANDAWVELWRIDGGFNAKTFSSNITLNAQSDLRFADSDSSNWVAFQAPATVSSNVTWTLPSADGSSGQALTTNGSGTLSWSSASADAITEGNTSAEVVDTGSDGHFKVVTEGTEALRIDNSGNVGIGADSLDALSARTSIGYRSLRVQNANITAAGGSYAMFGVNYYQHTDGVVKYIDSGYSGRIDTWGDSIQFHLSTGAAADDNISGSERMRIDSSGRLLVGTSSSFNGGGLCVGSGQGANTPSGEHVKLAPTANRIEFLDSSSNASDTGAISLWNTVYNNRSANIELFHPAGNTGAMKFEVHDGSSLTERMRIGQNGHLKVSNYGSYFNASENCHEFTTNRSNVLAARIYHNGSSGQQYGLEITTNDDQNDSTRHFFQCVGDSTIRAVINSNGGFKNYQSNDVNLCDEREKKNIEALDSTWGCLKNWELKKFHYNQDADTDDKRYGVIAQQVAEHCPEVIADWTKQEAKEAVLDEDGNVVTPAVEEITRMGVKEQQMMWMAIKALQEAQTRIETLETANASLEARLTALENA